MKKSISSSILVCLFALLPVISFASNPFTQLVNRATAVGAPAINWGMCGQPGPANPGFCSCFWAQAQTQCPNYHPPRKEYCTNKAFFKAEIRALGVGFICKRYPTPGTDYYACVTELNIFISSC